MPDAEPGPDRRCRLDSLALPYLTLREGVLPSSAEASGGPNAQSRINR